jgi:hypothetical protein
MAERLDLLLADHLDGWQVWDGWLFTFLSRRYRFALRPEFPQELGASI